MCSGASRNVGVAASPSPPCATRPAPFSDSDAVYFGQSMRLSHTDCGKAAQANVAALSLDHDPLYPRAGAGRRHVQMQTIGDPVTVRPGTGWRGGLKSTFDLWHALVPFPTVVSQVSVGMVRRE